MARPSIAESPDRYRAEADMLAPLAQEAEQLLAGAEVLFEVACAAGVPDLVLVEIDRGAVASRVGTTTLCEPVDVRIMLELQAAAPSAVKSVQALSDAALVSPAHLRRIVLPRLRDGGHVQKTDGGWHSNYHWRSLARRIVTVEVKLKDWRRGLAQASRHTAVADAAWLVLDERTSRSARSHSDWFESYGVGLASLSLDGYLDRIVVPSANRSRQPHRELLVERAMSLYRDGLVSGPVPLVFGSRQVATTGDDPRLASVAAD